VQSQKAKENYNLMILHMKAVKKNLQGKEAGVEKIKKKIINFEYFCLFM